MIKMYLFSYCLMCHNLSFPNPDSIVASFPVQLHPIVKFLFLDFVCSTFINVIISNSELDNIQVTMACQNTGFPGITHIWQKNLALVDTEHYFARASLAYLCFILFKS